jgi:hypothetical protein
MPRLLDIHFRPPLAFGRLGGSARPLENYSWRDDPSIHGASYTVIEPSTSLEVLPDGSVLPYRPSLIQFRDGKDLRPVAPFFELWATIEYTAGDLDESPAQEPDKRRQRAAGERDVVPLTSRLLSRMGGSLDGVLYTVHVANRKAARRTGEAANAFEARLQVKGNDHQRKELLASTPPVPHQEALVSPERPIPLGSVQVVRPLPRAHLEVDLDVLRIRFTPARGQVYGPPTAAFAEASVSGRLFEIVPPANRILNEKSSWTRYDGDYSKYTNPEPFDTYDGADQGDNVSWGVVDDTCDGTLEASVVVGARRYGALARICVGPPDYAPDRRPFLSLADDLTDRDVEPPSAEDLQQHTEEARAIVADLFERVFETASLLNLDAVRTRALGDNRNNILSAQQNQTRVDGLPYTDSRSMTVQDTPYADDNVKALIPGDGTAADTPEQPLPYSGLIPVAHQQLAQSDELLSFLSTQTERARHMLRRPYGNVSELAPEVAPDAEPSPDHRDPRIDRDRAHDMRMPPYMRDELGTALSLTRRQYVEIMRYLDLLSASRQLPPGQEKLLRATISKAALTAGAPMEEDSALRRRVRQVLDRKRAHQKRSGPDKK